MAPKPLKAWAIIDLQKRSARWTFHREAGKKIGLLAIYDKRPKIPVPWKKFKKVIRVEIVPEID